MQPDKLDKETGRGNAFTQADFDNAALHLATTYKAMKTERENIRRWESGEAKFTEDDALSELISITPKGDDSLGIRVQTSGTSDSTARIGEKLAGGYVEKRQAEIFRELTSPRMQEYIAYLDWKIGIVETAKSERMTGLVRAVFDAIYLGGHSYGELVKAYTKHRKLNDRKICAEKKKALSAVSAQVQMAAAGRLNTETERFLQMLKEEIIEGRKEAG